MYYVLVPAAQLYKKSLLLSFCLHTYIHLVTLYLQELSHFDNYPYDASGQFLRVFYAFLSLAKQAQHIA